MPKIFRPEEVRRTSAALALLVSCALLLASSASRAALSATPRKSHAFEFKSAQKNQGQPAKKGQAAAAPRVPPATLLQIIQAEGARRWGDADPGQVPTDAKP